ncbi:hypothetical protein MG293_020191 [Ovis ammon polii]|uniref:Uncharacterized protein n=1 Tax=Ovis ammon polii TaxID=230172 RepID=A0AAD4XZV6_OVIAM|nr:hypothetical protein MG293_020191 [Ovis ammon polii]
MRNQEVSRFRRILLFHNFIDTLGSTVLNPEQKSQPISGFFADLHGNPVQTLPCDLACLGTISMALLLRFLLPPHYCRQVYQKVKRLENEKPAKKTKGSGKEREQRGTVDVNRGDDLGRIERHASSFVSELPLCPFPDEKVQKCLHRISVFCAHPLEHTPKGSVTKVKTNSTKRPQRSLEDRLCKPPALQSDSSRDL